MKTHRLVPLAALALAAVLPGRVPAQISSTLDAGTLIVSVRGRQTSTEEFQYDQVGDSLQVTARARFRAPRRGQEPTDVTKDLVLVVNAIDFGLRHYVSRQAWDKHQITNSIEGIGDTVFTVSRQMDRAGAADRLVLPPGRLFVLDSQLFTLFDVICRNLAGKSFERRTINVVTFVPIPRVSESTVSSIGADTLRWGGQRVVTQKLRITDSSATFDVWVGPEGYLLRLENAPSGLRVEREPPSATKRRTTRG